MDDEDTRIDGRVYPPSDGVDIDDEEVDESPIKDWILENKALSAVGLLSGILVILAFWMFARPFFRALNNPVTYAVIGGAAILLKTWDAGYLRAEGDEKSTGTAAIKLAQGSKVFDGEIEIGPHNNYVVKPIRGRSRVRRKIKPLLVKHVDDEYSEIIGSDASPDDRFGIRISPELAELKYHSRHGRVLVAQGDRLGTDKVTRDAVVRLERPETVDKESYRDLKSGFQQLRDIVRSMIDENETLRVERDRYKRLWQEGADEAVDRFLEREVKLREAENSTNSQSQGADVRVMSPSDAVYDGDEDE